MPNLKLAPPGVTAIKSKRAGRRSARGKHGRGGWMNTMKVVFLLQRPRAQRSSPSVRQIALVVVSAGLGITVIRVFARRMSHGAGDQAVRQAETPHVETPQAETPRAETPQAETPEGETPEAETPEAETPEGETPEAETPEAEIPEGETPEAETAQPETQDEAPEATPAPNNDTVPASESSLTDRVQSEMARRADAPTSATGTD
jgi:hypothetical protein